jgi:uncharacterized protein (TIGR02996 family)
MDLETGFLQAIRESPDDTTVRLAYADWLEEHRDPRAEFLRLVCRLNKDARPSEWPLPEVPAGREDRLRLTELCPQIDPTWRDLVDFPGRPRGYLKVLRLIRTGTVYPLYEGCNYLGRPVDHPVDIDLEGHAPPDRNWSSSQHAKINCEAGEVFIEDWNSASGTFLNGRWVLGEKQVLRDGDVILLGTVQLQFFL